ncbi:MAG TPA: ATP-binding protein [Candidatus Saccharimonadales bacterium]|nr:ATP-binding protein [Candidatus Saccharimonadales bacterium]
MNSIPIKVRLTAWYFIIMAVGMSVLGAFALSGMRHSIRTTVNEQLLERVAIIRNLIVASDQSNVALTDQLRDNLAAHGMEELVQVGDESGSWIFQSNWLKTRALPLPDSADQKQQRPFRSFDVKIEGEPFHGVSETVVAGRHKYSVQVAQNMDDFDEALSRFRVMLLAAIPVLLLTASLAGYWISKCALAPVDSITRAAQEISGSDLSARLAVPHSGDELERLADTLNAMLARIDISLKRIAQFTADASHELRTPVALMRTRAEVALRRPRSATENQETIEQLHCEIVRTSELVERLMLLARADSGTSLLRVETVELVQLAQEVLAQTSVLVEHEHLVMEACLTEPPVLVQGDSQFLRQLLVILIDNAVKYTSAPGNITVKLGVTNGLANLSISDTGIGIDAVDLDNIFERFYRTDAARSRETGGAGLGLAIGRWIAESHGGTLTAKSKPGAGSTFFVSLPLKAGGPDNRQP